MGAYDGDTVRVDLDLGCGAWMMNQVLRLHGIDTPELRGEEREKGLKVRDYVRRRLWGAERVIVQTFKDEKGKFGRWLATIWLDGENLNEELLAKGMARAYGMPS